MVIVVAEKDIPEKQNLLGQFPTPDHIVQECLWTTNFSTAYIIEPSCGQGAFYNKLKEHCRWAYIQGIELDPTIAPPDALVKNFYDFRELMGDTTFIGNPPYRSPAYSLQERRPFVQNLMKKYGLTNIREEAVIFLVHTVDIILESGYTGYINYILPKAIFDNNSKAYLSLRRFLKMLRLISVRDLPADFDGVSRDVIYVSYSTEPPLDYYHHNGIRTPVSEFYKELDYIPFQQIFQRTNLGSVPCESLFLSIRDEPLERFRHRIQHIFSVWDIGPHNILDYMHYQGNLHLKSLEKQSKREVVCGYIDEVKSLPGYSLDVLCNPDNFKPIQHRNDRRFYVRCPLLKKASFVYELNRDPCPSFYFPGNPNKGSTDYFGFTDYDVNRNSSPGANRTVPLANVENNLQPGFKEWWDKNCGLGYQYIFQYLLHISRSKWYKGLKKNCQRFYFGIPKDFDSTFLETL